MRHRVSLSGDIFSGYVKPWNWRFTSGKKTLLNFTSKRQSLFMFSHIRHKSHVTDNFSMIIPERTAMNENRNMTAILGNDRAFKLSIVSFKRFR